MWFFYDVVCSTIIRIFSLCVFFFFSSRRRHTRCALVTGVQTCALPISDATISYEKGTLTLKFAVQPEAPHRFIGLRLTGTHTGAASIAEVTAAIRALPGKTGFILTRLDTPPAPHIPPTAPHPPPTNRPAFTPLIRPLPVTKHPDAKH